MLVELRDLYDTVRFGNPEKFESHKHKTALKEFVEMFCSCDEDNMEVALSALEDITEMYSSSAFNVGYVTALELSSVKI